MATSATINHAAKHMMMTERPAPSVKWIRDDTIKIMLWLCVEYVSSRGQNHQGRPSVNCVIHRDGRTGGE